jgi:hypothetical protein
MREAFYFMMINYYDTPISPPLAKGLAYECTSYVGRCLSTLRRSLNHTYRLTIMYRLRSHEYCDPCEPNACLVLKYMFHVLATSALLW